MPRLNKILIRQGTTTPQASAFDVAEPAWDATNGRLWIKGSSGMVEIGAGGGGGGGSMAVYASAASFPATGSATTLYLDSTRARLYRWVAADSVYAEIGTIGGIADSMDGGVYG